jgi:hypothetical protein
MTEYPGLQALEKFRSPQLPFIYVIEDSKLAKDVLEMFSDKKFGLETGFGREPTRVFHINPYIPWVATETDDRSFNDFKRNLRTNEWDDLSPLMTNLVSPIIAIKGMSTREAQRNAQSLVYRNVDYRYMNIVPYSELAVGQRITFIVSSLHVNEMPLYEDYLQRNGYNPEELLLRQKEKPSLSYRYPFGQDEYVLDVTKYE